MDGDEEHVYALATGAVLMARLSSCTEPRRDVNTRKISGVPDASARFQSQVRDDIKKCQNQVSRRDAAHTAALNPPGAETVTPVTLPPD